MKIKMSWSWELPEMINGIAIIIDINAATTNISMILARKAKELFIVNENNVARLKEKYSGCLVTGESESLPNDFFDANNCTNVIAKLPIENKTVLYMSNNGSRAIELAFSKNAQKIVICSFTNIHTVANWLIKQRTKVIYLIPVGDKQFEDPKVLEDKACADTLNDLLRGKPVKWRTIFVETKKYISTHYADFSEEETAMQFSVDKYPVLPLCIKDEKGLIRIKNAYLQK